MLAMRPVRICDQRSEELQKRNCDSKSRVAEYWKHAVPRVQNHERYGDKPLASEPTISAQSGDVMRTSTLQRRQRRIYQP